MNVLKAPSAMPSTSIAPAFALVSSQLPLAHLQLASELHCDWLLIWQVFQVENTPVRVATPTTDLTVASATSQREVADVHEHPVTASQTLCVVLVAQVSACRPRVTMVCKSFADLVIKSTMKFIPLIAQPPSPFGPPLVSQ